MSNLLTSEIVKRILLDIGATTTESFGRVGLTEPNFIIDKKITIRYNGDMSENQRFDKNHSIYSGQIKIRDSKIRGILIDLTVGDTYEFLFVFRMDSLPIHAARWYHDDDDLNYIKIFDEKKEAWIDASIYMMASLLASFERLVSFGVLWENNKEYQDLYKSALSLIG